MKLQGDKDNEGKTQWLVTREDERSGVTLKQWTGKHSTFLFAGSPGTVVCLQVHSSFSLPLH